MRCDCHVHIVGAADRYPQVPTRTYLAGVATFDDLEFAAGTGISRFVIVQPSFYGTDNTLLLESLDRLGQRGRGVAVIDPNIPAQALNDYAARGVRGIRINLYSPINYPKDQQLETAFAAQIARAHQMNWHVEIIAPLQMLIDCAPSLAEAPVPIVIDHYGLHGQTEPGGAEGRALLALIKQPHIWIKLSAPYRARNDDLATRPDPEWLAAILAVAPQRCVWGSDWPHTPPHHEHEGAQFLAPYRDLHYSTVVDEFLAALPSPDMIKPVMTDNPARLYGFT